MKVVPEVAPEAAGEPVLFGQVVGQPEPSPVEEPPAPVLGVVVGEGMEAAPRGQGCHVEVEAPPGRLGLRFETGTGHQVIYMTPTSALAGRGSVGDRLVSIRAPGREFYCGSLRTGS